jgi:hypothetical protein
MNTRTRFREELDRSWQSSRSLTGVGILMSLVFLACLVGLAIDGRTVTGAPVWLKPAKFAISSAIYSGTLAWLFRYIEVWPRFTRLLGATTAAVLVIEVGIIDFQASRGTISHFNVSSPFDTALWAVMGTAIAILWLASIGILVALLRQPFADRGLAWALRLGMLITVIGSASGGLMVTPTERQRTVIAETHHAPPSVGGHTVGAPDGGPGLPGVGWSSNHGDLRIPHFLGLHALQVVPLLWYFGTRRRRSRFGTAETGYAFAIASSYLAFVGVLTWQALRGQSIVDPDAATGTALLIWFVLSSLGILVSRTKLNSYRSSTVGVSLIP